MKYLLSADWFYAPENRGVKIKSPTELIVGLNRKFTLKYEEPGLRNLQYLLGQVLFYPPNVAGWPIGQQWIDSTTLVSRMRLGSLLLNGGVVSYEWFPGLDAELLEKEKRKLQKKLKVQADWSNYLKDIAVFDSNEEILDLHITAELSVAAKQVLDGLTDLTPKQFTLAVVSLPEYQLC